ncbi:MULTISPECIES: carboxyl transferase domain-containing protein [unclassified Streptomyces]|uniref:carboxyl transferase domain-containing protein n=1 Tax=unclassified Streptomyces TaxID=2593676 RepID=UPI002E28C56C|nr:carboxyl transferase domain-containing protein [Streptomyces sp. NBC_00223]
MSESRPRLSAFELVETVVDDGSFRSWDTPPDRTGVDADYARQLDAAAERSGTDESVITGEGLIRGRRVAIAACEFRFLAGSIGRAAAGRLTVAIERATREGIPLLAAPASGGTRMQEGTPAFVQMVTICGAVIRHKAAGLPYLVYLRHPTTGGVLASWGSLGHLTIAEPGALLGFLGPRVYEALSGEAFPEGVQTAENLYAHGLVDSVVAPEKLPDVLDRALTVLTAGRPTPSPEPVFEQPAAVDAWESILRTRAPERPGVREFLDFAAMDVIPLNGTGVGEADPGVLLALARFEGASCVVLGQDRRGQSEGRPLGPGSLRVARRGMQLASQLQLPLVNVIDTPGAALSVAAEEGGLAAEIARCLADLMALEAPSLTILLGQGCGGAALAMLPANRVIAAQHAWLSPLPPEGASVIVHRTTDRADEMARRQGVRAADLLAAGIVDKVVPERPDAAQEPKEFCRRLGLAVRHELGLLGTSREPYRAQRLRRYDRLNAVIRAD